MRPRHDIDRAEPFGLAGAKIIADRLRRQLPSRSDACDSRMAPGASRASSYYLGRGIGTALLRHLERFANDAGITRVFLSTTPFLDEAIALYERFGFVRCDHPPHELHGTPLFTVEKLLRADAGARHNGL